MSRIRLRFGKEFDFADPDSTPLAIGEIAQGLAWEFRYSNQTYLKMTVAQHCVMACDHGMVPDEHRLGMLLHDASESVMRDIAAPLKALLPDYRAIEERVQDSILRSLGVKPAPKDLIKEIDDQLMIWESRNLWAHSVCPDVAWKMKKAESIFFHRFQHLASRI